MFCPLGPLGWRSCLPETLEWGFYLCWVEFGPPKFWVALHPQVCWTQLLLWLPSVGSLYGNCTAVTLLLVWGNGGSIILVVLLGITLVGALCGGPTPIVVLRLDPEALGGTLRNLGGGSHVPTALLGTAYASPGPARAQPGVAEEWNVGSWGKQSL